MGTISGDFYRTVADTLPENDNRREDLYRAAENLDNHELLSDTADVLVADDGYARSAFKYREMEANRAATWYLTRHAVLRHLGSGALRPSVLWKGVESDYIGVQDRVTAVVFDELDGRKIQYSTKSGLWSMIPESEIAA